MHSAKHLSINYVKCVNCLIQISSGGRWPPLCLGSEPEQYVVIWFHLYLGPLGHSIIVRK